MVALIIILLKLKLKTEAEYIGHAYGRTVMLKTTEAVRSHLRENKLKVRLVIMKLHETTLLRSVE